MVTWIGTAVLALLLVGSAEAGEIVFTNGNRLAGEIAGQTLLVSTGSDLVEVAPAEVAVLTPDEVRLKDGRLIRGRLVGGQLRTRTQLGELAVDLAQLRMFRAAPEPASPAVPAAPPSAAASPAATPPPAAAPPPVTAAAGPQQVAAGAQSIGRGVEKAAKGVGATVVEGADRLHDGFKLVGLTIWEGMKSVGDAVQSLFGAD